MVSVLMTCVGDVALDEYNNLVEVDNEMGFRQIVEGVIHCQIGSEIMNKTYGFDLITAMRESYYGNSEMLVESLLVQAFDPELEKLIAKIDFVKAIKTGNEMDVIIKLTSVFNESVTLQGEVGSI